MSIVNIAQERGLFRLLERSACDSQEIARAGVFGPKACSALLPPLVCDGHLVILDGKYHLTRTIPPSVLDSC